MKISNSKPNRKGAMLPLIAFCLVIIFVVAAFAIDIARIHVTRAELRTATDSATRAAVEALGREQNIQAAIDAAVAMGLQNEVAGQPLTITPDQILFGSATPNGDGSFTFEQNTDNITSVQVTGARRNSSADGPVPTTFAHLLGTDNFELQLTSAATQSQLDCALVLDLSGSMNNEGRIDSLRLAMEVFVEELTATQQEERLSLTSYSDNATKLVDMTPDLNLISDTFNQQIPAGFTNIGEGMEFGLNSIENDPGSRPFAQKFMIVMTDGRQNRGIPANIVARDVADSGVIIHTVTFSEGANQNLMQLVAQEGNGTHLHADNRQQLVDAFREIAQQIANIQIQ